MQGVQGYRATKASRKMAAVSVPLLAAVWLLYVYRRGHVLLELASAVYVKFLAVVGRHTAKGNGSPPPCPVWSE